jgi:hypothetical protein
LNIWASLVIHRPQERRLLVLLIFLISTLVNIRSESSASVSRDDPPEAAEAGAFGSRREEAPKLADTGAFGARREESPEVIEGGASRRGSERATRDQARGRGRNRPSREPVRP